MITKNVGALLQGLKVHNRIEATLLKNFSINSKLSNTSTSNSYKQLTKWNLFASVCIERMPVITCDVNDLENRYSNLINELNVRKSLLSDHELRHLKDLEVAEKRKQSGDQAGSREVVIETAVDYEDQCLKQLQSFTFAERHTSQKPGTGLKKPEGVLKNLDRILDKKLLLIVYDPVKSQWQLPELQWNKEDDSLRHTAQKSVNNLHKNDALRVNFLGNAPAGVYKTKPVGGEGEKHYIFKAHYRSGGDQLAFASKFDYAWIRKEELPDFIKNTEYLECLNNLILDF